MRADILQEELSQRLATPISLKRKISLPDLRRSSNLTGSGFENILETKHTAVWSEANSPLVSDYKFIKDIKLRGSSFSTSRRPDIKLKIEFAPNLKRVSKTEEKMPTFTFRSSRRDTLMSSFRLRSPQLSFSDPVQKPEGDHSSDLLSETTVHQITFSEEDLIKSVRKIPFYLNMGELPINRKNSHTSLARVAFLGQRNSSSSKPASESLKAIRVGQEKPEPSTANSSQLTLNRLPGNSSPQKHESPDTRASSTQFSVIGLLKESSSAPNSRGSIVPRLQDLITEINAQAHHGKPGLARHTKPSGKKYLLMKKEDGPLASKVRNFRQNH